MADLPEYNFLKRIAEALERAYPENPENLVATEQQLKNAEKLGYMVANGHIITILENPNLTTLEKFRKLRNVVEVLRKKIERLESDQDV
jgi:hypothetical protein